MKYFESTVKRLAKAKMAVTLELMVVNREVLRLTPLDENAGDDRYCDELGENEELMEELGHIVNSLDYAISVLNFNYGDNE